MDAYPQKENSQLSDSERTWTSNLVSTINWSTGVYAGDQGNVPVVDLSKLKTSPGNYTISFDTTLTQTVSVVMPKPSRGAILRVARSAGGAFNVNVGSIRVLDVANTWVICQADGTAWHAIAFGSLGGAGTVTSIGLTAASTRVTIGGSASPITGAGSFTVDVNQANLVIAWSQITGVPSFLTGLVVNSTTITGGTVNYALVDNGGVLEEHILGSPDELLSALQPSNNEVIPSQYCAYVTDRYEIVAGYNTEIQLNAVFEIG